MASDEDRYRVDLDPELDALLRVIPAIKEELHVNVELASPAHFIQELSGWRDRSPFVIREGSIDFHHYDFYAQALSKIERAHARDVTDVREMAVRGSHRAARPPRVLRTDRAVTPSVSRYRSGVLPARRRADGPGAWGLRSATPTRPVSRRGR
jgi:hypothetical protein